MESHGVRQKRLKAGTACTNCRKKKLRCTGTPNCVRCVAHKLECVVDEALFLKTNSPQSLYSRTGMRPFPGTADAQYYQHYRSRPNLMQQPQQQQYQQSLQQGQLHHPQQQQQQQQHQPRVYHTQDQGFMTSPEMMEHRPAARFFQYGRRMSGGSVNSFSSQGSCPSPYPYNYEVPYSTTPAPSSNVYSSCPDSPQSFKPHIRPGFHQAERIPYPHPGPAIMPSVSNGAITSYPVALSSPGQSWTVDPAIRNEDPSERIVKRKNDGFDSDAAPLGQGMDANTSFCASAKVESPHMSRSSKQDADVRSTTSMVTLDGHGQQ
ncbi:hypothetical protein BGZ75_006667 [Mortierella antarctica]|nr:hypothetical protein BGZ75_006667 [Mortierella antarctica]